MASAQKEMIQALVDSVHLDSLKLTVSHLTGLEPTLIGSQNRTINSRYKGEPGNQWAATYLKQRLEAYGYITSTQNFDVTGQNVYAIREGNQFPDQAFVICAHYDAIAIPYNQAIGADDNASGCAAVIEAARLLKDSDFPYTLIFVFFDEEEQGLVGSKAFNSQFDFDQYAVEAAFNLDMIAYDDNHDFKGEINTRPYAHSVELAHKIWPLNDTFNIGLDLKIVNPGTTASDHDAFWQNGISAILLIEDDNDFHRYYHTKHDSMQYFHDSFFYRNAQFALASLCWFASNPNQDLHYFKPESAQLRVYPNPAGELVTVEIPAPGILSIYDLSGKKIADHSITEAGPLNLNLNLNTPLLLYFQSTDGSFRSKMILLRK